MNTAGSLMTPGRYGWSTVRWLTDKFCVTWQIVPAILDDLFSDDDDAKRERVMAALLKAKKLDIEKLIVA
jgi:predicted 3-demethylubiquinone-9 3-methyltransferase (glyoxalase superfamily)